MRTKNKKRKVEEKLKWKLKTKRPLILVVSTWILFKSDATQSSNWNVYILIAACRDRDPGSGSLKEADVRRLEGTLGRGSIDPQRYATLLERDRERVRGGGEIRGVGSGVDGLRQPPSGMSSFSITEPSDCPLTPPERTPPPPLTQGSTATVLARYWPPPDGQPGRQIIKTEGTLRLVFILL